MQAIKSKKPITYVDNENITEGSYSDCVQNAAHSYIHICVASLFRESKPHDRAIKRQAIKHRESNRTNCV